MFKMRNVRKFQNLKAFSCHLAKMDLAGRLPQKFVQFSGLLAKARTRSFEENDLGFACSIIAKLASYEGMDTGYYCKFNKSIPMPKNNGDKEAYLIKNCVITCQKHEMEEVRKEIENSFFDKYKIRIKLKLNGNSQNRESFFASKLLTIIIFLCNTMIMSKRIYDKSKN